MLDQDRVSKRAHAIWESSGKPDGAHDEHWQQACREMEVEQGEAAPNEMAVPKAPTNAIGSEVATEGSHPKVSSAQS